MVGSAAPLVGGLLLGPAGAVAGSVLAQKLGVPSTPDDLGRVIQGDPDALVKIKAIESEERVRFEELATQLTVAQLQADVGDRDSARKREIALHDMAPVLLGGTVTLGFFVVLGTVILHGLPSASEAHDAVLLLLGALSAAFGAVVQYYFGSSRGSDAKSVLLAKSTGSAP